MHSILHRLCAPMLGASLLLILPVMALAEKADLSVLPPTKEGISELNDQQIKELRRVERACMGGVEGSGSACVISDMESYINSDASPELKAFHESLPLDQRYNSERPWAWVQGHFQAMGVIPKPE